MSAAIATLFNCAEIDGTYYMLVDTRNVCFDEEFTTYAVIAAIATFLYPLGIPLAFSGILYSNKDYLYPDETLNDQREVLQKRLEGIGDTVRRRRRCRHAVRPQRNIAQRV